HRARPAQSCPPPRTDKERPASRAARIANCTSCGVRQWATARGMRPIGFAQSAVAAIYRLSSGLQTRPGSCPSSRPSVLSIKPVIVLPLLRPVWDTLFACVLNGRIDSIARLIRRSWDLPDDYVWLLA